MVGCPRQLSNLYGILYSSVTHPGGGSISAIQTLLSLASTARIKGLTAAASRKRRPCLDLAIPLPRRFIGALLQTPVYASLGSSVIPHIIWQQRGTAREDSRGYLDEACAFIWESIFFTAGCYLDHHSLLTHFDEPRADETTRKLRRKYIQVSKAALPATSALLLLRAPSSTVDLVGERAAARAINLRMLLYV